MYNLNQGEAISKLEQALPFPSEDVSFLNDTDTVRRAFEMARKAHEGEVRKIRKEPFITHPIGVARIASEYKPTDFVQGISLLHDVVDSPVARSRLSMGEIREALGLEYVLAVGSLSKTLKPVSDKEARLEFLATRRAEDDPDVQLVCSADKLHNLEQAIEELRLVRRGFFRHFKGGRTGYLRWPADVLKAIEDSGALTGHPILERYHNTLDEFYSVADEIAS